MENEMPNELASGIAVGYDEGPTAITKQRIGLLFFVCIALLASIVTSIGVVAVYDLRYAQKIVSMDLQGYIRAQRDRVMSGELTDEQLRRKIDAMEAVLLAEPDNHTVLLKEVVLRNAREIRP
jgi:hypothetical protein